MPRHRPGRNTSEVDTGAEKVCRGTAVASPARQSGGTLGRPIRDHLPPGWELSCRGVCSVGTRLSRGGSTFAQLTQVERTWMATTKRGQYSRVATGLAFGGRDWLERVGPAGAG